MQHNKNDALVQQSPSPGDEMTALRGQLAGKPYAKEAHTLLPDVSKAHFRNVVNGRTQPTELVLAALKLVANRMARGKQRDEKRLIELTEALGEMQAVA